MKYYAVAEMEITDKSWVREYVANVTKMVEQRGGRFLARTAKIEKIEGERKVPPLFVMVEWPSKEAVDAFYASEEYRPYLQMRIAGSKGEFLLVAGEDVTRTARVPE